MTRPIICRPADGYDEKRFGKKRREETAVRALFLGALFVAVWAWGRPALFWPALGLAAFAWWRLPGGEKR
ncbi:MAG: hypothetical protein IMX05_00995 [Hydrogenibacillus schlegelii]|nr:hypothetical protein [Hydrogenibacillus schlegelii]